MLSSCFMIRNAFFNMSKQGVLLLGQSFIDAIIYKSNSFAVNMLLGGHPLHYKHYICSKSISMINLCLDLTPLLLLHVTFWSLSIKSDLLRAVTYILF